MADTVAAGAAMAGARRTGIGRRATARQKSAAVSGFRARSRKSKVMAVGVTVSNWGSGRRDLGEAR